MNKRHKKPSTRKASALIKELRNGDAEQIGRAAEALANLGPAAAGAVPTLVETLTVSGVRAHPEWYEQGEEADGPEMDMWEREFSYDCRIAAAQALGRLGPVATSAIPALLRAVREDHSHSTMLGTSVAREAGEALVGVGPDAIPPLLETLTGRGLSENSREIIEEILGHYGVAAVPAFLNALRCRTLPAKGRRLVIALLADMGGQAVPELIRAVAKARGEHFATLVSLLGKLGPSAVAAVPLLQNALASKVPKRREAAVAALKSIQRTQQDEP